MIGSEKYLKSGIQNFCGEINQAACYALCLLDVGQEYNRQHGSHTSFDMLEILEAACSGPSEKSVIYYNRENLEDNDNFWVTQPAILLKMATGKEWDVRKEGPDYKPKPGEYLIGRYERVKTGAVVSHFDRENFHPWLNSATVKYGKLVSVRVCKVMYG